MLLRPLIDPWPTTVCSRNDYSTLRGPSTDSACGHSQTGAAASSPHQRHTAAAAMPSTASSSSQPLRRAFSATCASTAACGVVPGSCSMAAARIPGGARGVSVSATEIRAGMLLEHEGKLLEVVSQMHNAGQARQGGNVMLDCRDVRTSTKTKLKVAPAKTLEVRTRSSRHTEHCHSTIQIAATLQHHCVARKPSPWRCMRVRTRPAQPASAPRSPVRPSIRAAHADATVLTCHMARDRWPHCYAHPNLLTARGNI